MNEGKPSKLIVMRQAHVTIEVAGERIRHKKLLTIGKGIVAGNPTQA